jgi:hypothetical protein
MLLDPDWITAPDCATLPYGGIDTDDSLVLLSRRAQDT